MQHQRKNTLTITKGEQLEDALLNRSMEAPIHEIMSMKEQES
jgi:hypothetical protein